MRNNIFKKKLVKKKNDIWVEGIRSRETTTVPRRTVATQKINKVLRSIRQII